MSFFKDYIVPESCIPINGYCRSVVYDLNRNDYDFIPNLLYEFLIKIKLKKKLSHSEIKLFNNEYFNFLLKREYIIKINKELHKYFKEIETNWSVPYFIGFIYVKISDKNIDNLWTIISNYEDKFFCRYVSFIIEDNNDIILKNILEFIDTYETKTIHYYKIIILSISRFNTIVEELSKKDRILNIVINDSNIVKNDPIKPYTNISNKVITTNFLNNVLENILNSSVIPPNNFTINILMFFESKLYNSYFNKKLFIDDVGKYYLTYKYEESINIDLDNIETDPPKLWKTNKDKIDICRDCEFRYMCIDSRIPKQRLDNTWYYETECDYNPYISKWKGEGGYINLEETGVMCNDIFFKKDENLIKAHQERLWSD